MPYASQSLRDLGIRRIEIDSTTAPFTPSLADKRIVFFDLKRNWEKFAGRLLQRNYWETVFASLADQVLLKVIVGKESKRTDTIYTLQAIRGEGFDI